MSNIRLRPATAEDRAGIIALIDRVYREYGEALCLENADADLLTVPNCYTTCGGAMVVLAGDSALGNDIAVSNQPLHTQTESASLPRILGTHAVAPKAGIPGVCTFRRLYLDSDLRSSGWGQRLMQWAVDWSLAAGLVRVEFWSDTRFERAHHFFARCGLQKTGEIREMDDGVEPYREYGFQGELTTVARQLAK